MVDFPNNPSDGDTHTEEGTQWKYSDPPGAWSVVSPEGVSDFTSLTDTPASYSGQASKLVAVTVGEDALEFINTSGGGLTISDTAPVAPQPGDLWLDSSDSAMATYVWYDDGDSTQWVLQSDPHGVLNEGGGDDYVLKTGDTMTGDLVVNTKIGIGESSPSAELDIRANGTAEIFLKREDDTVFFGNNISRISTFGGVSGTLTDVAQIDVNAAEDWTPTSSPTYMRFRTTESGSVTPTEKMRINPGGYVGIGTINPQGEFHVSSDGDTDVIFESVGTGSDPDVALLMKAPTGGEHIVNFLYDGAEEANLQYFGAGPRLRIETRTATGYITLNTDATERARVTQNGDFLVAKTALDIGTVGCELRTTGQARFTRDTGEVLSLNRIGSVNSSNNIFSIDALGSEVFRVRGDGDVENLNNRYGSISDARLKENIVDAKSQWDDIKNIRVRNFNFIGKDTKHIGVVAQEVEPISPGLVGEDDDGYKNVGYTILYMKAVKALQEAMERIEILESEVAALKGEA